MKQVKRIFIVGHPGAGKALVAKTVAEKLGWQFVDADFGLESRIGRNLSEILGEKGVDAFHHAEHDVLTALLGRDNLVVTTDAAVVENSENIKLLEDDYVVYLKVSTAVQLDRMARNPVTLLRVDIEEFLNKLHQQRDGLYEEASKHIVNSDDGEFDDHISSIIQAAGLEGVMVAGADQVTLQKRDMVIFHGKTHQPVHLSGQQAITLKLLAQGSSSKEIAIDMGISHRTVEGYITIMMEKLGCASSKELISLYLNKP